MKRQYFAMVQKDEKTGKKWASVYSAKIEYDNLVKVLRLNNIKILSPCETQKCANELVLKWNTDFQKNGELYDPDSVIDFLIKNKKPLYFN